MQIQLAESLQNGVTIQVKWPVYVYVVAALSLCGCLTNMMLTIALGLWKETLGKMVIALSMADAMISVLWFFKPGSYLDAPLFFAWSCSVSLVSCFAYSLVETIKHADDQRVNSMFCKVLDVFSGCWSGHSNSYSFFP